MLRCMIGYITNIFYYLLLLYYIIMLVFIILCFRERKNHSEIFGNFSAWDRNGDNAITVQEVLDKLLLVVTSFTDLFMLYDLTENSPNFI